MISDMKIINRDINYYEVSNYITFVKTQTGLYLRNSCLKYYIS